MFLKKVPAGLVKRINEMESYGFLTSKGMAKNIPLTAAIKNDENAI
jgi:hypothetical protein